MQHTRTEEIARFEIGCESTGIVLTALIQQPFTVVDMLDGSTSVTEGQQYVVTVAGDSLTVLDEDTFELVKTGQIFRLL